MFSSMRGNHTHDVFDPTFLLEGLWSHLRVSEIDILFNVSDKLLMLAFRTWLGPVPEDLLLVCLKAAG